MRDNVADVRRAIRSAAVTAMLGVAACGESGASPTMISPTRRTPSSTEQAAVMSKLDPARDYIAEGKAFDRLVTAGSATESDVRDALKTAPDRWYRWTADSGEFRAAEYDVRGIRAGCPFFEAFAHLYERPSFGVFYKRFNGAWRAIDGGFMAIGTLKPETLER